MPLISSGTVTSLPAKSLKSIPFTSLSFHSGGIGTDWTSTAFVAASGGASPKDGSGGGKEVSGGSAVTGAGAGTADMAVAGGEGEGEGDGGGGNVVRSVVRSRGKETVRGAMGIRMWFWL